MIDNKRRRPELNRRIRVLQTPALPLGDVATYYLLTLRTRPGMTGVSARAIGKKKEKKG